MAQQSDEAPAPRAGVGGIKGNYVEAGSPATVLSEKGNVLAGGATEPSYVAAARPSDGGGHAIGWVFSAPNFANAYYDGAQWRRRLAGYGMVYTQNHNDGVHRWQTSPASGNPDDVVATMTALMTLSPAGYLSVLGTGIGTTGYVSASGDVFSSNWVTGSNGVSAGAAGMRTTLGGTFQWAFHWNGSAYLNVDNATGWLQIYPACDERLKQDIALSSFDCLATIARIPLHQFRWMDNAEVGKPKRVESRADNLVPIGLVAQRVQEIAPALVSQPPPGKQSGLLSIDQNNMLAALIGAIQQLAARVEALEAAQASGA